MLLVFDCSGSMVAKWGKTDRITAAKNVLIHIVDSLRHIPDIDMGLRCYGFQHSVPEHDCKDTKLVVPFKANNAEEIIGFIKEVKPRGYTPIAYSLQESAKDFPASQGRNVIVLITDGIEECGGDPCSVSQGLQAKNIFIKPYIIGIGFTNERIKFFECVGTYYNPQNEVELNKVFSGVIAQALDNTAVQVHLMNQRNQPVETDVAMTFSGYEGTPPKYKGTESFYHTLNALGRPDSFYLNPALTYNLKVFTTPPLLKTDIRLEKEKLNIITLNAQQGELKISGADKDYLGLKSIVRQAGKNEILFAQDLNSGHKFLAGSYDVEVLTMPRLWFRNVAVTAGETRSIALPAAGELELNFFKDVIGSLYVIRGDKEEWVTDINISGDRSRELYTLQQGRYLVVYRIAGSKNTEETSEQGFYLNPGSSISLKIQ